MDAKCHLAIPEDESEQKLSKIANFTKTPAPTLNPSPVYGGGKKSFFMQHSLQRNTFNAFHAKGRCPDEALGRRGSSFFEIVCPERILYLIDPM
jgi:hypothetical protein